MNPPLVSYQKPFLSIVEQITLLKSRGMHFNNEKKAKEYLENINYYRLCAYWLPFEENHQTHTFKRGTTFERVLELYVFDRELRLLMLDAIERIEVSIRSRFSYELSEKYGSHFHLNETLFKNPYRYEQTLSKLKTEIARSKEPFIKHFKKKYKEDLPPIWASVELMTLGQVSNWFSIIKHRADRQLVAKHYGVDEKVLASFLHHLTIIRNISAHHSVLWNKRVVVEFTLAKSMKAEFNHKDRKKLFNTFVMVEHLMNKINENNHWRERLENLIDKYHVERKILGYGEANESI
jgi:abortive infection bacteriophage resistance protein